MQADPARHRPRALFICQRIPFPPNKGDKIPAYHFLRHLQSRYDVHVATFVDDPADAVHIDALKTLCAEVFCPAIHPRLGLLQAGLRWLGGSAVSVGKFQSDAMRRWIRAAMRDKAPALLFCQSSNVAHYALDALDEAARTGLPRPVTILHYIDVDSEKFAQLGARGGLMAWIYRLEARRVRREEARCTDIADGVTFISAEERALFESVVPGARARLAVLPNGVDAARFDPSADRPSPFGAGTANFLFTGAMDYAPNIEAAQWFAQAVMPVLRQSMPEARFWIVGSNPAPAIRALTSRPNIEVTGRVEAVEPYLQHATACVAPLRIARGVQNKVLEAMAMARPVIVSAEALTGIGAPDSTPAKLANSVDDWAGACLWAAMQPREASAMGQAARRFVEARFSWEAQFAVLDTLIGDAASGRGSTTQT